jgi:epoxyqueuosine reductase
MGDWIFGCDICQIICPWNKPGQEAPEILEEFQPRDELLAVDLFREIGLSQEEFSSQFKGSPIKRTKRRGYMRNIAIALGNRGDPDALSVLEKALEDQELDVHSDLEWAIKKIQSKS